MDRLRLLDRLPSLANFVPEPAALGAIVSCRGCKAGRYMYAGGIDVLTIRSLLAALLVPGTVVGLIPWLIVADRPISEQGRWTAVEYGALIPIGTGAVMLLWCIWDFAVVGRGTLAPIDPPTTLVQRGLYCYVRNPMYVGALLVLVGETVLFRSMALLAYTAVWFTAANLFVLFYEEPALRRRFGRSYEAYCQSVGRWLPK